MDPHELIALILWTVFGLSIIALVAGCLLAQGSRRTVALTMLFSAVLGTLAFSFISGFSVGRFTAVIPVFVSGYVIGMGRGRITVGLCVLGAAVMYVLFSWLLTPLVLSGGVLALLFGFWAMPVYAVVAPAAFGWAALNPPRVPPSRVTR